MLRLALDHLQILDIVSCDPSNLASICLKSDISRWSWMYFIVVNSLYCCKMFDQHKLWRKKNRGWAVPLAISFEFDCFQKFRQPQKLLWYLKADGCSKLKKIADHISRIDLNVWAFYSDAKVQRPLDPLNRWKCCTTIRNLIFVLPNCQVLVKLRWATLLRSGLNPLMKTNF